MIICDAVGGLNNRLRCLVSTMRMSEEVKLVWTVKETQLWLWCGFEELFENDIEVFRSRDDCVAKYPKLLDPFKKLINDQLINQHNNKPHGFYHPIYSSFKFIKLPNDSMDINHLYHDNWGDDIPNNIKESVLTQVNNLRPIKYIRDFVSHYESNFDNDTITFSIRTWKDAERNNSSNGRFFDINTVFDEMDKSKYNQSRFFVTCDHQGTFDEILDRYGDKIIYTPKRTFFGDYKTLEGIQDSAIDLLLGGKNKLIVNSKGSSYCDMQWWFGGARAGIKILNTNPGMTHAK